MTLKFNEAFKLNLHMLKKVWKLSKSRFFLEFTLKLWDVFYMTFVEIYLTKVLIDSIIKLKPYMNILGTIALIVVFRFFNWLSWNWYRNVYQKKSNYSIMAKIRAEIREKQRSIDLLQYDDPEFYDKKIWASRDGDLRHITVFDSFSALVEALLGITTLVSAMFVSEPLLIGIMGVYFAISFIISSKQAKVKFDFEKDSVNPQRRMSYSSGIFFSTQGAKDLRLYKLSSVLKKDYAEATKNYRNVLNTYGKRKATLAFIDDLNNIVTGELVPYLIMALKAILYHSYTAGTVYAVINVIGNIRYYLNRLIGFNSNIKENALYIKNYLDFMDCEVKIPENPDGSTASKEAGEIILKNVSFKYPTSKDYVLKNINMRIKPGEKIAIVGHNGAGKSTLVKLIMRLYLPSEGEICLNGKAAREYNLTSLRESFGVIFQDFQIYAMSVAENVLMDTYDESKRESVEYALQSSGLYERVCREANNINTSVLKEYDSDGIIFSGGQAQKLAIARIFANVFGTVIMDEPSSALDPVSEYEINQNMLKAAEDKTVILISHRLSSTCDADRIYFFDNGEITEEGTHEELMAMGGKYAYMFNLQAEKYR